jgi:hypothetical protein
MLAMNRETGQRRHDILRGRIGGPTGESPHVKSESIAYSVGDLACRGMLLYEEGAR